MHRRNFFASLFAAVLAPLLPRKETVVPMKWRNGGTVVIGSMKRTFYSGKNQAFVTDFNGDLMPACYGIPYWIVPNKVDGAGEKG